MSRYMRRAGAVAAAIAALLVTAPNAAAVLTMWSTSSTMSSPSMTLTINAARGPIAYPCPVSVSMAIAASGALSMPVGSLTPIGGSCPTIVQGAAWSGSLTALLGGGRVTGLMGETLLPANGMLVTLGVCRFSLSGRLTALGAAIPAPTTPLVFGVFSWTMPAAGQPALTLTVANATAGCGFLGIANGNSGSLAGTMSLTPELIGQLL